MLNIKKMLEKIDEQRSVNYVPDVRTYEVSRMAMGPMIKSKYGQSKVKYLYRFKMDINLSIYLDYVGVFGKGGVLDWWSHTDPEGGTIPTDMVSVPRAVYRELENQVSNSIEYDDVKRFLF